MKSHVVIRVPKRALFALVPLLVMLLVAEVAVRLSNRKSLAKRRARSYSLYYETTGGRELVPGKGGSLPFLLDPHLTYRTKPNLRFPGVTVNAQGFRGADWAREKQPGTARVVALGGSLAFGYGCTTDEAVWAVPLARLVGAGLPPGQKIEILNAGVTGYTSIQERILLETQLLDYAPDVVLLLDGWNDMRGSTMVPGDRQNCNPTFYEFEEVIERQEEWGQNLLRLSVLYGNLERSLRRRAEARPLPESERFRLHPDGLAGYRRNLDAMCRMARSVGARVLIVLQPELFMRKDPIPEREVAVRAAHDEGAHEGYGAFSRATYPLFRAQAQEAARAADAGFLDATTIFDDEQEAVFVDWVHLDDRGHELLAEAVAPSLLEALGARTPSSGR